MGSRGPTLLDVARAAGVSRSTASYVFNEPARVSADARERVHAAAAALGYVGPDPTAASLRRGRANAVGVLFTDTLTYAFADPAAVLFLQGVAAEAEAADVALTLLPVPRAADGAVAAVRTGAVDGVLAHALPEDHPALAAAAARRLPLVRVDMPPAPGTPSVRIDDRAGARSAAEHVLGLGHRRIAVLADRLTADGFSGPAGAERRDAATYPVARERLAGYGEALAAAGLDPAAMPVYECGGMAVADGARGARALLAAQPPPTAVLAMTDQLARGALRAARERGLRVPADVSVVGFDDVPAGDHADLTTIHQDHAEKGARAARLLLASFEAPRDADVVLPVRLLVRGSTAARPA